MSVSLPETHRFRTSRVLIGQLDAWQNTAQSQSRMQPIGQLRSHAWRYRPVSLFQSLPVEGLSVSYSFRPLEKNSLDRDHSLFRPAREPLFDIGAMLRCAESRLAATLEQFVPLAKRQQTNRPQASVAPVPQFGFCLFLRRSRRAAAGEPRSQPILESADTLDQPVEHSMRLPLAGVHALFEVERQLNRWRGATGFGRTGSRTGSRSVGAGGERGTPPLSSGRPGA